MTACPVNAIQFNFASCGAGHKGLLQQWHEKLVKKNTDKNITAGLTGALNRVLQRAVLLMHEILSPRVLFSFCGFFMGMVFISSFGTKTLHRLLNLLINGSFLFN